MAYTNSLNIRETGTVPVADGGERLQGGERAWVRTWLDFGLLTMLDEQHSPVTAIPPGGGPAVVVRLQHPRMIVHPIVVPEASPGVGITLQDVCDAALCTRAQLVWTNVLVDRTPGGVMRGTGARKGRCGSAAAPPVRCRRRLRSLAPGDITADDSILDAFAVNFDVDGDRYTWRPFQIDPDSHTGGFTDPSPARRGVPGRGRRAFTTTPGRCRHDGSHPGPHLPHHGTALVEK